MKCPICQWETKEENPRFCAGCGWEFKLFLSDVGEAEKAAYAERVAIARKNWAELQEFRAGKKAAPEPPKETGSAGSPSEAKVPELTRDPFETAAEFEKRINDTPAIPAGTARLIREEYDIDSGRFPVKVEWWDWAKALPGLPKDGDGLHVVAKRDLAKAIYESGPEHGISVKLMALDEKAAVDGLVLLTDKGPIPVKGTSPVKRPSPGAEKRISGPVPGMEFVWIPPGEFWMGSPEDEPGRDSDESPRHRVRLTKGFHMQTTPVTQAQWEALTGENPSHFKKVGPNAPVENVSWDDARNFIQKLNQREKNDHFRLPTEAEWEYACRAGSVTAFCNGPITANLDKVGWFDGNSGGTTHPVGQKRSNAWGLHDMHGNVWEWCRDWYGGYPAGNVTDPTGPETGDDRVARGGSWGNGALACRSALRRRRGPGYRISLLGFRLVRLPGRRDARRPARKGFYEMAAQAVSRRLGFGDEFNSVKN